MASPTLTVRLDDGTGTFPYDITRYVMATDGYEITRGRDDWQGAVTAGQLTLTLNNSDGRFTPGSTLIASPSPIKVDQQITVWESLSDNSGAGLGFGVGPFGSGGFGGGSSGSVTYTRFTGFVKAWPVEWPATVSTFAEVRLTATDAQARAERRTLRSALEEEILRDSPNAYFTLAETSGSVSAGDTSGNGQVPLTIQGSGSAPTFGTGLAPGLDGLTGTQFFAGQRLQATSATPWFSLAAGFSVECFVATTDSGASFPEILIVDDLTDLLPIAAIGLKTGGAAQLSGNSYAVGASVTINDGALHHLAVTCTAGGLVTGYVDGVSIGTVSGTPRPALTASRLSLGAYTDGTLPYTGTVSHAAVYSGVLSPTRIAVHAAAGVVVESGTARLARLAGYAGLTVGAVDTSLTNVSAQTLSGSSAQDAIQAVTDTEFGVTYIDGSGSLVFHNRNRVVAKSSPDLTLSSQWVTPDVAPVLDDQQIINYFEATSQGVGATVSAGNAASQTSHGRYPVSQTYLTQTSAEALDRAGWTVAKFAEPTTRYGTLTINLFGMTVTQASTVLAALDVDCWLRVTSMAAQNPGGTTADVVVQGFRETVTAESWAIVCNVVSRSLYTGIFTLDSSLLDGTDLLYV